MSDWGKGVINDIGWGQGADNNIGWGSIYDKSNAGETLLSGIDPQAQAQITRIENAGGTIEDANVINEDIKFLKSIGLFANLKYAVDPRAGIIQRVDGGDTFASKIFDYSGSDADTANATGSEQPQKGILNGITALDFDGDDDRLTNEDTVTFLEGSPMFSVAVYAQDFINSSPAAGMVIDKFSPDASGLDFGRRQKNIALFATGDLEFTAFQTVQIIASGISNTSNLVTGFINNVQKTEDTININYVGKSLGSIRNRGALFYAKAQFQKNWDFNALPTTEQAAAINTYLTNQFNIS